MAKKLILKSVWSRVQSDSKFIYYKNQQKVKKQKDKLKLKKYNPNTRKHEYSLKKTTTQ